MFPPPSTVGEKAVEREFQLGGMFTAARVVSSDVTQARIRPLIAAQSSPSRDGAQPPDTKSMAGVLIVTRPAEKPAQADFEYRNDGVGSEKYPS